MVRVQSHTVAVCVHICLLPVDTSLSVSRQGTPERLDDLVAQLMIGPDNNGKYLAYV